MTMANALKDRVSIQVKTTTQTALGETVVWSSVSSRYARVIPLDARARAVYMQMQSEVTHKIIFAKGAVTLTLGNNRINHGSKTYEPMEPTQDIGNSMVVMVKEI